MQLTLEHQVFMLFFAIIWGAVANVRPRWKAFQWPLIFRHPPACHRLALSVGLLNVASLMLFGYALWTLGDHRGPDSAWPILHLVGHGILPAFALFGCYRLWLATVEAWPDTYYSSNVGDGGVPQKYQHAEPIYRTAHNGGVTQLPIVELGPDTAFPNACAALLYLAVGMVAPWICK
jgi:hypothetical protein